jgi:hypothetical protein
LVSSELADAIAQKNLPRFVQLGNKAVELAVFLQDPELAHLIKNALKDSAAALTNQLNSAETLATFMRYGLQIAQIRNSTIAAQISKHPQYAALAEILKIAELEGNTGEIDPRELSSALRTLASFAEEDPGLGRPLLLKLQRVANRELLKLAELQGGDLDMLQFAEILDGVFGAESCFADRELFEGALQAIETFKQEASILFTELLSHKEPRDSEYFLRLKLDFFSGVYAVHRVLKLAADKRSNEDTKRKHQELLAAFPLEEFE